MTILVNTRVLLSKDLDVTTVSTTSEDPVIVNVGFETSHGIEIGTRGVVGPELEGNLCKT